MPIRSYDTRPGKVMSYYPTCPVLAATIYLSLEVFCPESGKKHLSSSGNPRPPPQRNQNASQKVRPSISVYFQSEPVNFVKGCVVSLSDFPLLSICHSFSTWKGLRVCYDFVLVHIIGNEVMLKLVTK